jgi:hypothetical protein
MKGPYERLKYDLRRIWECPVCQRRERTTGDVTSVICKCQEKEKVSEQRPMRLIADGARRITAKQTDSES